MVRLIRLNGQQQELSAHIETVLDLLNDLHLAERILIVEKNQEILNKEQYGQAIMNRDQIEIIHFVGGG